MESNFDVSFVLNPNRWIHTFTEVAGCSGVRAMHKLESRRYCLQVEGVGNFRRKDIDRTGFREISLSDWG